ncbi:mammalian ependymin-related protein 1 [Strongylocentrotus purpuratus]|uniref:Uncharacterized protein n=1 Tax=Strongylocentrotus purpuratus TaxID=7668 RepID=A0A7M7N2E5_STRPU|nr:mammalian ependymin-related protein 1 [Strongylocentrotus purpuratus]
MHCGTARNIWRNYTIPPNSTLEDFYEIGAPGSGFMVQEWSDRTPGKQNESRINTNTYPGCWPMTEVFMKKDEQNRTIQSVSTRFFDLHSGIQNMSVFTPPALCKNAQRPMIDTEQSSVHVMSEGTGKWSDGDTVFDTGSGEEGSGEESLESGELFGERSGERFDGILKM